MRAAKGSASSGSRLRLVARLRSLVVTGREAFGLVRLASIEKLHRAPPPSLPATIARRAAIIVQDLLKLAHRTRSSRAPAPNWRATPARSSTARDMIHIAERDLMAPLDQEAARLVSLGRAEASRSSRR